jgi:hypothetical protein
MASDYHSNAPSHLDPRYPKMAGSWMFIPLKRLIYDQYMINIWLMYRYKPYIRLIFILTIPIFAATFPTLCDVSQVTIAKLMDMGLKRVAPRRCLRLGTHWIAILP